MERRDTLHSVSGCGPVRQTQLHLLSCISQTTADPAKESFSYQSWRTSRVRAGQPGVEAPLFDLHRNDKTRPERST